MIIDHCENLKLDKTTAQKRANELRTLQYLRVGLAFLNHQVLQIERRIGDQFKGYKILSYGNDPRLSWVPKDLIACSFHWYATSCCNYVWLVGWLAQKNNQQQVDPKAYAESVIPEVVRFRHKVAAHLAQVFPKGDNPADLMASIIYPIAYDNDAFYVDNWTITRKTNNQSSTNSQQMRWSLTKVHSQLMERYWPEQTIGDSKQAGFGSGKK